MPRDFEAELEASTDTKTSIDMQIDKYLIEAERDATTEADIEETNHSNLRHNSLKSLIREILLLEQPEENPDPDEEEETEEDIEAMLGLEDEEGIMGAPTGGGGAPSDFDNDEPEKEIEGEKSEEDDEEKPEEMEVERKAMINVDGYCSKVARLVKNYDDMLTIKDVIVNRAVAYISENYGEDAAFVARQSLKMNFDL